MSKRDLKALWAKVKQDPIARDKKNAAALARYRRLMSTPEGAARLKELGWTACLRRYGLTSEQYEAMWRRQAGKCAICGLPEQDRRLSVDHCHATRRVRGLLCRTCNLGLGQLRDSREFIRNAIEYLTRLD